jgi:hypothetical protein
MESTLFKTFNSITEFNQKTVNRTLFVRLSNGWFVPVSKKSINLVAKSMKRENELFSGKLDFCMNNAVQITIN